MTTPERHSREEHLAVLKRRALEYLDRGDVRGAWLSLASDLRRNPVADDSTTTMLVGDAGTQGCSAFSGGMPRGCGS
jgi:hypothetical protein